MLVAVFIMTVMGLVLGGVLGAASRFLAVKENPLEEELKALLPGSQCGQCGYVGCAQAAAALAKGEAAVTLCPPGGKAVAEALAKKLGVTADLSGHEEKEPEHAYIIEELCIGCTRCIRECTTDSIMGASKLMHTIIVDSCHGCGKCAPTCPTEAIVMVPYKVTVRTWAWPKPEVLPAHHAHPAGAA
jgi:electron transport complex protein RnfB